MYAGDKTGGGGEKLKSAVHAQSWGFLYFSAFLQN